MLDARRGEVFTRANGAPAVVSPEDLQVEPGSRYVGDGAVLYRGVIEAAGGVVPEDESDEHVPWARNLAGLAAEFGPADTLEPLYLRVPDAEKNRRAGTLKP